MNKFFFVFLLCLIPLALSGQRYISGHIADTSGVLISAAHVFIANTTAGATTDAEGYYLLQIPGEGSYRLAISHVAYEPFFVDIDPGKASKTLDVVLRIHEFGEVEVALKVKTRKRDIDLFWKTLLGRVPSKKSIHAINPEAVYYYYNSETQKLTVTCRVPLRIINNETGYRIQYVLNFFTHDYNTHLTSWEGEPVFEELEPRNYRQKRTWEKNRQQVYQVSVHKFVKSLYYHSLMENGFLFSYIGEGLNPAIHVSNLPPISLPNPKNFISSGSDEGCKTLYIPPDSTVVLVCYGKPVTEKNLTDLQIAQNGRRSWFSIGLFRNKLITPVDTAFIYPDGTFRNPLRFTTFASSHPLTGLSMILPIEYASGRVHDDEAIGKNELAENESGQSLVNALDSAAKRFDMQLSVFPQEKVYLHTDKPYYTSGERIWFRAHVVDAASHTPVTEINCIYAELFDVRDSVVSRVKIDLENDAFSGYIPIPEDIPEGDYTIRAYTNTMRNLDEDYFFLKNIRIGNHQSRLIQTLPKFEFLSAQKIGADIRFTGISPLQTSPPALSAGEGAFPLPTPESVKISINSGKPMKVKCANGVSGISFKLPPGEKQRVMLLDAMYNQYPYRQYIKIPLPDDDFDVTFYPEGGSTLYGCKGRIAFKALQRDGTEIDVTGIVYDWRGNEITRFKTDVRGMGQFFMTPERDDGNYYAVCANHKGQAKRFELPAAKDNGYTLSAVWNKDYLTVKTLQPEARKTNDTLCLIIHTRGVVQDVLIWENISKPVAIDKDFFPSGVSNLLLLTKDMIPVSERLVFVHNNDQANVVCSTDRAAYPAKSPVEYAVSLTDESGEPLEGSFSVSVTDDHEVAVDTTFNILTSLLLTSDLRGNIPDPAFYFRKNNQSAFALDLLMLTQGWRRYDTERIVRNDFMRPDTLFENGFEISGRMEDIYRKKPIANASVSLLSLTGGFFAETTTDRNGRFYLHDGRATDSTWFIVQKTLQSSKESAELMLALPSFPERRVPMISSFTPKRDILAKYAEKTEQQYVDEQGARVIHLSEVVITAKRKPEQRSSFYHTADYSITLKGTPPSTLRALLYRLPGVSVSESDAGFVVQIARFASRYDLPNDKPEDCSAMFMIDDFPAEDLSGLNISDIVQIDLLTSLTNLSVFGTRGKCGVIAIYTRSGKGGAQTSANKSYYTKKIMPLGFQKPVEFYAPKYDTPAQNTKPDLRTTIHWQPNLTTDETGTATFSFYTADAPSTYTVAIEGVTEDGKIVCKRDKILVVGK